jgi:adenylate cyclase
MPMPEQDQGGQSVDDWVQEAVRREKSGDYLGACDSALLGLEQHPSARELQYRAILNLSRIGANKRARQLWSSYQLRPDRDREAEAGGFERDIAALGARLDREEAFSSDPASRPFKLKTAAENYESVYRRTASTFLAINAAVLHELSGASERGREIAAEIMAECAKVEPKSQYEAYQLAADRAAASLLLDDLTEARKAIEQAGALADNAAAISSTRKQLMQICNHKKLDSEIIGPLRNPNVIHYTGHMIAPSGASGRFPAHAEARVSGEIQSQLKTHNVGYGYGSLACGADTLIVERLLARRAEVGVVLPFETESFVKESVASGGANWLSRFHACLKQVRIIHATEGEYVGDPEVFGYASRLAMGLAILRAQQLASEPMQLAVWDGQQASDQAGTSADVNAWRGHGLKTLTINSDGNLATMKKTGSQQRVHDSMPPRRVRAILFGDFHGFSKLTDQQMLVFYDHVMRSVAIVLDKYTADIATRNTWGDGLYVIFTDLGAAARCALEIQSVLGELNLAALGLPKTLALRLGLDAGAIFEIQDPVLKALSFTGTHISRTARLEPSTPPGEVYVLEAFAALFALLNDKNLICEYVGMMQGAKNYGRLRTYLLRRRSFTDRTT